jgi:hypothetical protein
MSYSVETASTGRLRSVKQALKIWTEEAYLAEYSQFFVTMNPRYNINNVDTYPFASIKVSDSSSKDVHIGRKTVTTASQVEMPFTIHIYEKKNEYKDEDHNRDAWVAARILMNYLKSGLSRADMTTYRIHLIKDITARESDPRARRTSRVIISGVIEVTRVDS